MYIYIALPQFNLIITHRVVLSRHHHCRIELVDSQLQISNPTRLQRLQTWVSFTEDFLNANIVIIVVQISKILFSDVSL